ncbi:MAG: hypothetical protein RMZ41_012380 [Nostoc sp. DedVER02]|uniref:hypothetical protein n=1 Tax=unclassified Nostoc TaxID=2593658 RepID=UPI002AD2F957|nr:MULTISPECIES: hypothetical protein [unclassified Nostoc]MDZ7984967.1 hypothetical protein [Nostoc sp. DedVER02]MDZ8114145.1 hypothetical protein [Nostoc sp. DedVER01b]
MDNKPFSSQKEKVLLAVAYSLPVVLLFWFVTNFSVNVPFADDWGLVDFFEKIHSGTVNFRDFFSQHNEHRILFPRIIFAILAFSSKWNIKLEIYFTFLLALVNFIILYKIAAYNWNEDNKILFILFNLFNITACLAHFSLNQYENWLWGFQITWLFINTCLILAIFILTVPKNLLPNIRLLLASLCCFIASFSSAHGLLSWVAILPSVYLLEGTNKQKKIRILVWMGVFAFCVAIYSIGYEKPSYHPNTFFIFQKPLIASKYFFTLIGFSLLKNTFPPVLTGLIILLVFFFFNLFSFTNQQSNFANKAAPWLSLGWFAVLFASMTTVGRAGFGVEQATSSRYISVSILLFISCLQLCGLWILYKWQEQAKKKYIFLVFCLSFLISISIYISTDSIAEGQLIWIQRKAGKNCLELINYIDKSITNSPSNCLNFIFPDQLLIRKLSPVLQKLEFRDFPQNLTFITKADKVHGYIDLPPTTKQPLNIRSSDVLKLSGWAILPEGQEQPPIVLLSYGNSQSFFATGFVYLNRPDVAKALNSNLYNTSGWEAIISLKSIPAGESVIKAWVYDRISQQFIKLNGEPKITVVE